MAVIIKGKSIKSGKFSRDHYLRGAENERIVLRKVWGFATEDPDEALQMIALLAKGSRCKKPLYSSKINPETDRLWTDEELYRAIELLEGNLSLTGHPRIVIEHKKHGRVHYHVLWSRFHPDGSIAVRMSNDYAVHRKTQRQIEAEFKLRPMMAKGRDFKLWEVEWAKRYGFDIFELRQQITADFNRGKSGQEFMAALKAKGIALCRGDKSQLVLILPWGQHKALSSMIHGRPTKAVLRRSFADIDIKSLPTVQEGKATVMAALPKDTPRAKYRRKGSTGGNGKGGIINLNANSLRASWRVDRKRGSNGNSNRGGNGRAFLYFGKDFYPYGDKTLTGGRFITLPMFESHKPLAAFNPQTISIKSDFRRTSKTVTQKLNHQHQNILHRPAPDKHRWPLEARVMWDNWGHKNPPRFFSIWQELSQ